VICCVCEFRVTTPLQENDPMFGFPFSSSTRFQLTMLRAPVIEDAGEGA
jgi:hypothetical protein